MFLVKFPMSLNMHSKFGHNFSDGQYVNTVRYSMESYLSLSPQAQAKQALSSLTKTLCMRIPLSINASRTGMQCLNFLAWQNRSADVALSAILNQLLKLLPFRNEETNKKNTTIHSQIHNTLSCLHKIPTATSS